MTSKEVVSLALYFYGAQAEQYASVEIPKELLTGKDYSSLSASAKMLYAVLLDRMSEAKRHTIIDCMNELEEFGLICKLQYKGIDTVYIEQPLMSEGQGS